MLINKKIFTVNKKTIYSFIGGVIVLLLPHWASFDSLLDFNFDVVSQLEYCRT